MDVKTLSVILGHASVAFMMDIYIHVLDDHKQECMALMEGLFEMFQSPVADVTYPVLVTSLQEKLCMFLSAAANCGDEHPVRVKPVRASDVAEQITQNEQPVYTPVARCYIMRLIFFVAPCLIMRYNVNSIL